nr:MAG TPA: hypothetical protein [Bacteriophage sp.]
MYLRPALRRPCHLKYTGRTVHKRTYRQRE